MGRIDTYVCGIVKQLLESGVISLDFIKSELNSANPLNETTKQEFNRDRVKGDGTTIQIRRQE